MRFRIKKLVLQSLVEKAGAVVSGSGREILPVLKNFHVEAIPGEFHKVRIVATDLDLAVIAESEMVMIEEPGESVVPAKKFIEMVKEAGDCEMSIITNGDTATITTPNTSWSMALMQERYPPIPDVTMVNWTTVPAGPLAAGMKKVRNAISMDLDKRPELTLVKCGVEGIFATDGARLHCSTVSVPEEFQIPASAVDDLVRMMRGVQDTNIRIAQTENHILFEITNHVFIATKLQAEFPSIGHILATRAASTMELQVSRDELVTAIKRARITADEETNRVVLVMENHTMSVETRDKLGSTCRDRISVHWPHARFVMATNHIYLTQAIADMESPNVRMLVGQDRGKQKAPIILEEPTYFAIINQLRIEENDK